MSARYELRQVGIFDRELGRAITMMDNEWAAYQAWLDAGGHPDPEPPPPARALEYERAEKIAKVEDLAGEQRRKATAPSTPSEMSSWTEKLRQAKAYDGTDAAAPMLAREGAVRGTSTQDIVTRVLNNASALEQLEAVIAGTSGRHKDALRACATLEDLDAYDIEDGWPLQDPKPSSTMP